MDFLLILIGCIPSLLIFINYFLSQRKKSKEEITIAVPSKKFKISEYYDRIQKVSDEISAQKVEFKKKEKPITLWLGIYGVYSDGDKTHWIKKTSPKPIEEKPTQKTSALVSHINHCYNPSIYSETLRSYHGSRLDIYRKTTIDIIQAELYNRINTQQADVCEQINRINNNEIYVCGGFGNQKYMYLKK